MGAAFIRKGEQGIAPRFSTTRPELRDTYAQQPLTLELLRERWKMRDEAYGTRKIGNGLRAMLLPLTVEEIAAIRAGRRQEAAGLTKQARLVALDLIARWTPPHQRR